jgi:hypothetical protein
MNQIFRDAEEQVVGVSACHVILDAVMRNTQRAGGALKSCR